MKKQLVARIRNYGKSLFFTTTTVLVLSISANAQANTKEPMAEKAEITHLGSKDASSLFNVKYANETGERFSLVIRDASGVILFNEVYEEKNFDKKFLFTDIESDAKLLFTISSLKNKKSQTYETSAVRRVVDDVVVTRLK